MKRNSKEKKNFFGFWLKTWICLMNVLLDACVKITQLHCIIWWEFAFQLTKILADKCDYEINYLLLSEVALYLFSIWKLQLMPNFLSNWYTLIYFYWPVLSYYFSFALIFSEYCLVKFLGILLPVKIITSVSSEYKCFLIYCIFSVTQTF